MKKADISLPEGDVNPVAPLPKHIMSIMVSHLLLYVSSVYLNFERYEMSLPQNECGGVFSLCSTPVFGLVDYNNLEHRLLLFCVIIALRNFLEGNLKRINKVCVCVFTGAAAEARSGVS